jgi:hypothetical protein
VRHAAKSLKIGREQSYHASRTHDQLNEKSLDVSEFGLNFQKGAKGLVPQPLPNFLSKCSSVDC